MKKLLISLLCVILVFSCVPFAANADEVNQNNTSSSNKRDVYLDFDLKCKNDGYFNKAWYAYTWTDNKENGEWIPYNIATIIPYYNASFYRVLPKFEGLEVGSNIIFVAADESGKPGWEYAEYYTKDLEVPINGHPLLSLTFFENSKILAGRWSDFVVVDGKDVIIDPYTNPREFYIINESEEPTIPINPTLNKSNVKLKAGSVTTLKVSGDTVTNWYSTNTKTAKVKSGKTTALKKGTAVIYAMLKSGKYLSCKVTVTTSPKLNKSSVSVKKGKTVSVKITGKASTVKNVYTNTKYAKVISKNTATTIKVKGLKKGSTTLKIKVNGVVLKLKVKVK